MAGIFLCSRGVCLRCARGKLTPAQISGNFDCLRVPEDEIGELKVVMTAVGGKSVFEAEGLF